MRVKRRFWFYRPSLSFGRLSPIWFGDDEFHRKTLVAGWNATGQVVVALWHFRNCAEDCEGLTFCPECTAALWPGDNGECWTCDTTCHCGRPVTWGYDGDDLHHRGMCKDCDAVRCDAYPGACGRAA